ncbi:glycine/betaine ABC transporter ATP-binding protein [Bacillus sp. SA1-12]|uniref:ABC transporter ATP-binding protein n=1 Tax=Bacillus sp. SA1-12 TaxID=1455638 RepID=UPI000626FAB3|nr:ABC transporter ATP-binding protein [Bacillus sp. SA1-12]KKI90741.1 glycine/betaine ABC transporter ATP-binding protein [Bacillus sp. SA1-12]
MIKLEHVQKKYSDGYIALKDINLECKEGEITVLIGPSGCGKSTTLKLLNRLINPTKGKIYIDGKDISNINPVKLRREIGYVIQHIGLFPHLTISENVAVVPHLLQWDNERIEKRVDELLDMVGLDPDTYRNRRPSELSGGQQQRVGVIRAMAAEPSIILMDEAFSALDPISREQLQDELIRLQKDIKKTIVFVTHDMDEALKIADKIVLMKDGEIVQEGTPENILRHPANDFVKNFIGKKRLQQVADIPIAEEVMNRKPATTFPSRGLAESVKMMERRQVDSLLVVNDQNELQGYITIYDVLNQFRNETKRVSDILQPFQHAISPNTLLTDVMQMIDENKLPYIPVVNDEKKLLGIVTRGSIVGFLSDIYPPQTGVM